MLQWAKYSNYCHDYSHSKEVLYTRTGHLTPGRFTCLSIAHYVLVRKINTRAFLIALSTDMLRHYSVNEIYRSKFRPRTFGHKRSCRCWLRQCVAECIPTSNFTHHSHSNGGTNFLYIFFIRTPLI